MKLSMMSYIVYITMHSKMSDNKSELLRKYVENVVHSATLMKIALTMSSSSEKVSLALSF